MSKATVLGLVAVLLAVLLAACGTPAAEEVPPEETAPAPQGETYTFTLLVANVGNEFWANIWMGMEDAINTFDLPIEIEGPVGPPEWNGEQQLTSMDQVIATHPDVIIMTASDSRILIPGIERAVAEGIIVQGVDVRALTDLADFVGTDFREMGVVMGQRTVELCQEDIEARGTCQIGITEIGGAEQTALRHEGLMSVLGDYPEIEIVGRFDDRNNPEETMTITSQMLTGFPDLRVLLCYHGQGAAPMATAVRNAGLTPGEDVYVIGNDLGTTTLDCIEAGDCDGTVGQDPYVMGYYAVINAYVQLVGGMENRIFDDKPGVDWINSGTTYVTRENLASMKSNVEAIQDAFQNR